jgi:hypothetical protein
MSNRLKFIIIFLLFIFSSPWFLLYLQNYPIINFRAQKTIFSDKERIIDEINTLRGESIQNDASLFGKILVNKVTFFGKEMLNRYSQSFDPHYLFFKGGIEIVKGIDNTGQIPLTFIPPILYAIYTISVSRKIKRKALIFTLFLLTPVPSITPV